jgi:iron-sulfur cluster repair protein YtfE (RIC family)
MADFDITTLILSEHEAFRRAFTEIESLSDPAELASRWSELADQLEVHAAGEEEIFYPALLRKVDDSEGDTEHAIKDHNKIRDAVDQVAPHEVASDAWWDAFRHAREETVEHLEEEEHDVLPPFQSEVDEDKRSEIGMRWLKFHEDHEAARGLSGDKLDPKEYVEENSP